MVSLCALPWTIEKRSTARRQWGCSTILAGLVYHGLTRLHMFLLLFFTVELFEPVECLMICYTCRSSTGGGGKHDISVYGGDRGYQR